MPGSRPLFPGEVMVVAAAREIRDGDVVFVGMRLPLIAFRLAKMTHAPRAFGVFENGLVRGTPSAEFLYTMSDTPNVVGAHMCTRLSLAMALLGRGRVDLGFIGGAEVDRFGNVNSSYIGSRDHPGSNSPAAAGDATSRRWHAGCSSSWPTNPTGFARPWTTSPLRDIWQAATAAVPQGFSAGGRRR